MANQTSLCAQGLAGTPVRWHTGPMSTKRFALAVAAVAATGFGLAAQTPKPAVAAHSVVVYKSPT